MTFYPKKRLHPKNIEWIVANKLVIYGGDGVLSFVVDCVVYYIDFLKLILHIFVECTAQRAFVSINLLV